jgi:hypothetical protein
MNTAASYLHLFGRVLIQLMVDGQSRAAESRAYHLSYYDILPIEKPTF